MSEPTPPGDASGSVIEAARTYARDRYLSALLASAADERDDLVVLAAFLGEVGRIPLIATDATVGEIRLQWWRDALGAPPGASSGNPVADAVREVAERRSLDPHLLLAPLEGNSRELYEDGIADSAQLDDYADETEGAPIRLALAILGQSGVQGLASPVRCASRALALTRLALTLPQQLAHGRLPLPSTYIGQARDPRGLAEPEAREAAARLTALLVRETRAALAAFRAVERQIGAEVRVAFLPVTLVDPYLKAIARPGRDPLLEVADISPLSRIVKLWFAHWRGRF